MPDRDFAGRLAEAMNRAGLNQAQLAKAMGVSPPTVSRWLAGTVPHRLPGIRLCSILGVVHEWLMRGIEPKPDRPLTDAIRQRLKSARQEEGISIAEMAKQTGWSAQVFEGIEDGSGADNWTAVAMMMAVLNLNEAWLMDGKGRKFLKDSSFVLIPPGEIEPCKKRAVALREQAQFLVKQAERLEFEIKESEQQVARGVYYPALVKGRRKRQ